MHRFSDYEKYICGNLLVALMSLLDEIHNEKMYNEDPSISIIFILVDQILKSFDNQEYQNLDRFTRRHLTRNRRLEKMFGFSSTNISKIMGDRSDDDVIFIEKAIDEVIETTKPLTEWALGYEITEKTQPFAKVEIYWLIKSLSEEANTNFEDFEDDLNLKPRPVFNGICYQCLDGHPHDVCDRFMWTMSYPPFAGEYW